jgi:translocation and assembly module TamA
MKRLRATNRIATSLLMFVWLTAAWAQESGFSWRIELEAPDEVRPLLENHLDIYRYRGRSEVDALLFDRLVEGVRHDAKRLLETGGFFSTQVEVAQTVSDAGHVVHIHVEPGAPARVDSVALDVTGAIVSSPEDAGRIPEIKKRWRLPAGARFRQGTWGEAKNDLLNALVLDGYPTARIAASEARVDPKSSSVALSVRVDSGPLFRFGAIEITGLKRYPRELVENLSAARRGERYTHDALLRYQAALQASGYFSSASVSVDPVRGGATTLPVVVRVTEYPAMKLDLGLGYSTDTGPRARTGFSHYNTFRPGWQSQSKLTLAGKQQTLDTSLALLPEPDGWRNRVGAEADRTDVQGLVTERLGLTAGRAWRSPRMERDIVLKLQSEAQKIEGVPGDNVQALSLNYSWTLRRVDDPLRPKHGYLLNLQLGGAAKELLTTRSFVRTYARGLYILPFGQRDRVHLRAEAGAVWARARDGIPNEFLFRTGGDQTIRGYAYQSLGVSQNGAIVGARYLAVSTVEYQHDFTSSWGGAVFVDSGNAVDKISDYRAVRGYGVGVRWYSPAGSLNFDVARASEDGKFRFHFTIGARF